MVVCGGSRLFRTSTICGKVYPRNAGKASSRVSFELHKGEGQQQILFLIQFYLALNASTRGKGGLVLAFRSDAPSRTSFSMLTSARNSITGIPISSGATAPSLPSMRLI